MLSSQRRAPSIIDTTNEITKSDGSMNDSVDETLVTETVLKVCQPDSGENVSTKTLSKPETRQEDEVGEERTDSPILNLGPALVHIDEPDSEYMLESTQALMGAFKYTGTNTTKLLLLWLMALQII